MCHCDKYVTSHVTLYFATLYSYLLKWHGVLAFLGGEGGGMGLKFEFLVFCRGSIFASSLKPIVVFSRVPNFGDLLKISKSQ